MTGGGEAPSLDEAALDLLCRRVAYHCSVAPGLAVGEAAALDPLTLHQPRYLVLHRRPSAPGIRPALWVVTYAFVGGPVRGRQPAFKHTPFLLRLKSADLLGAPGPGEHTLHYAAGVAADVPPSHPGVCRRQP
jgi:hypothetical protein